jgi:4-carboxymuconolactone decarboxylase
MEMARVKLIEKDQAAPEIQEMFGKIEYGGAKILNLYRSVANSPGGAKSFIKLGNSLLTRTTLSSKLREMAILRIAKLTGSEYEWAQHIAIALECGVLRQQADDLAHWKESGNFSDEERAILQYVDEVTVNVRVDDDTFNTLRKYLSEENVVDLTLSIGYWGMVARVLVALQVDIDKQTAGSSSDLFKKRA